MESQGLIFQPHTGCHQAVSGKCPRQKNSHHESQQILQSRICLSSFTREVSVQGSVTETNVWLLALRKPAAKEEKDWSEDTKSQEGRVTQWHTTADNSCVSWVFSNLGDFKYVHYNKCQNPVLKQLSTPWTTVLAHYYVLSSDCLGELSHVYFQLADFLLYDCIMINHGFELNYMMNYTSPHRKLQDPEIIFGTLVQTTQQQFIDHIVKFCRH